MYYRTSRYGGRGGWLQRAGWCLLLVSAAACDDPPADADRTGSVSAEALPADGTSDGTSDGTDDRRVRRAADTAARSAEESAEPPAAPPTPTLTAVFVGEPATRLLAANGAVSPPMPAAAPVPQLASAGPAPAAADAGPGPPPLPPAVVELDSAPIPQEPRERPDDEIWELPEAPQKLVWRHPAPAAGLQLELLEAKGRSWPTRVRVEPDGDVRVGTLTPLAPMPAGSRFRLVARVVAADGSAHVWTEPLRVRRSAAP